jgi:putative transposase
MGTREIARDMKVSRRRVQQIWKCFKETGEEPILGHNIGRPRKPYVKREADIVREAHSRYKFGARMVERVIRKQYKVRISHNRIHMYLKAEGLAREDPDKKRRKWSRYERKHSLSAEHIDWYEEDGSDIKVCIILDDASIKVLAGGEFSNINTENSKLVLDQVIDRTGGFVP